MYTTIREQLAEMRDMLDAIDGSVGDLVFEDEHKRYVTDSGTFSYGIGETGAELLTDKDGGAYIDVSVVEDGVMDLDDDSITELIEALRALQAFRAAQGA